MDGIATVYYTVTTTDTTSITDDTVTTTDTTATADGTVTTKTAATADNTKARGPHLWSRAYRGNALSASERETLAGLAIETDTRDFASSLRNITEGIVDGNKGKHWKIRFKGDEIVMRDVGMKILRWVNRFKEIGDIIVQYDPGHSALPWAGFRFLLKLLLDKQETVDAILVGLEKTAYLIHRCAIYELLYFTEATRASKNLELSMLALYVAILKFLAKAIQRSKVEYSSSDKAFPANPSTDTRVEAVFTTGEIVEYFEDVTSLEETVERDAAVAEAQCFESLRTLLDDINILTSRLSPQIDGIQQRLEGSRRSDILEWISKIPYTNHHKRISEVRLKGTGEWLFKKTEYHNWRSSSASKLLLLRGIPGAGKTFIASRVIDSFLSSPNAEKLAYFYCNRAEENRRQPESILNTLIQQLAQTESDDDKLLMPLVCIYEAREKRGQKSSHLTLTESQELLVQLTDIYPQTTICIDALDEVENETRIQLLKSLKYVVETSKNRVKIFATTRMDIDILRQLEMFPRIDLQPDDNVGDINRFVETKVRGTIDDGLLLDGVVDRALNAEICDVLCERSKGMFQLAALQVTFLCDMTTRKDVINSLKVLPETLTAAYGEIYKRILSQKGSAPRLALNAFRWIQCSYEPLASETLLDAVTVELDSSGEFSHDKIQVNDVLKACQNLLILDEGLDVFRFAHLSVDEYFETQ
ncbi:hypothetical protein BZA05DRAFT_344843, partial [Tricharina praecox]|uniref:uncharacterized protein n=1 Tax=Tricharina praecox TaxID=43433 RepID=UPI00221EB2F9